MPKTKPAKNAPEWAAKLTTRERTFVEHFVISLNATKAAIAAGYRKGAHVRGHQLLGRAAVAEAVATLVAERSGVTGSLVLAKLGAIVNTNVDHVATVKGGIPTVKDTDQLTPDALVAVAGYDVNEKGFVTVKLHDRIRALELLSKILGMRRSPSDAPTVNVAVQVNNTNDAAERAMARVEDIVRRQQAALPAPSAEPMPLISAPIKEIEYVESRVE